MMPLFELKVVSGNSGSAFNQIFAASKRNGNPSIEGLLSDVLNISGSMARDYINRKPGMDDKHSDIDQIYAAGG